MENKHSHYPFFILSYYQKKILNKNSKLNLKNSKKQKNFSQIKNLTYKEDKERKMAVSGIRGVRRYKNRAKRDFRSCREAFQREGFQSNLNSRYI